MKSTPDAPRVPLNDLARRWALYRGRLLEAMGDVIEGGAAILGPQVRAFEIEFARYCGVEHCVGVGNGTDALEIALRSCGVEAGSRVVTVANAGGYATTAIRAIGAEPVYVDIDPNTLCLSPDCLEQHFSEHTAEAVVLTHLYGQMARVDEIAEICRLHDAQLIEDCAQAHGARFKGRRAGAWGAAAAFSFYPTKNLGALGDAGAVVTNNSTIAATAAQARQYGWRERYVATRAGARNSRLDEVQAAVLRVFLEELDEWNAKRRAVAQRLLATRLAVELVPPADLGEASVWHLFVVRVQEREAFRDWMRSAGIETAVHYPVPDYRQPAHSADVLLPVTESATSSVVTVPCFPEISDVELARVADALSQFPPPFA